MSVEQDKVLGYSNRSAKADFRDLGLKQLAYYESQSLLELRGIYPVVILIHYAQSRMLVLIFCVFFVIHLIVSMTLEFIVIRKHFLDKNALLFFVHGRQVPLKDCADIA